MNRTVAEHCGRWVLLVGPAFGLAILELLHPNPLAFATIYQAVGPVVEWWIQLHLLLALLFALAALALVVSLAGQTGLAPTAARVALGLFVVGNSAFIGTEGIGVGLVIRGAQGLPSAQQAGVEQAVQALWEGPTAQLLGNLGAHLPWVVGILAGAVALYQPARRQLPLVLVGLALAVAIAPVPGPELLWWGVNSALALVAVAIVAREAGASAIAFGLLLAAALLPQHGSPPGAVGVACLGLGLVWLELSATRPVMRPTELASPAAVASRGSYISNESSP